MQTILMQWLMEEKKHEIVAPNIKNLYRWEADIISITKSTLVHEFEIKVSRADFLADRNKKHKHGELKRAFSGDLRPVAKTEYQQRLFDMGIRPGRVRVPNYFWYVINGFDVSPEEVPPYAGTIKVVPRNTDREDLGLIHDLFYFRDYMLIATRKAPRIHREKISEKRLLTFNRWLSYKLKNMYIDTYGDNACVRKREENE